MIVLHIAIQGDNKNHGKNSLIEVCRVLESNRDPLAREEIYRAWIEPLGRSVIDRDMQQMAEVVR